MEKNLKLKNDIWIWHISLQNNGYRLPEIISDIIYKYTKTTVSILSHYTRNYDEHMFRTSKEELICHLAHNISHNISKFVVGQSHNKRCSACGTDTTTNTSIIINRSSLYICYECRAAICEIHLASKCENYIYNNNSSPKLGKYVDAIVHTLSNKLQFFCRNTIAKDVFYSMFQKAALSYKEQCTICTMTRINYPFSWDYSWNSYDSSCNRCRTSSRTLCRGEWICKFTLINQICPDVILPLDILKIIINLSLPQYFR